MLKIEYWSARSLSMRNQQSLQFVWCGQFEASYNPQYTFFAGNPENNWSTIDVEGPVQCNKIPNCLLLHFVTLLLCYTLSEIRPAISIRCCALCKNNSVPLTAVEVTPTINSAALCGRRSAWFNLAKHHAFDWLHIIPGKGSSGSWKRNSESLEDAFMLIYKLISQIHFEENSLE